mmetsp:Transcript_9613/g.30794  ORF Transcript_9613/g.30794 Transcript_9613/m.30794 type:complete len:236 (+) Transcript_9613:654-1361(+)
MEGRRSRGWAEASGSSAISLRAFGSRRPLERRTRSRSSLALWKSLILPPWAMKSLKKIWASWERLEAGQLAMMARTRSSQSHLARSALMALRATALVVLRAPRAAAEPRATAPETTRMGAMPVPMARAAARAARLARRWASLAWASRVRRRISSVEARSLALTASVAAEVSILSAMAVAKWWNQARVWRCPFWASRMMRAVVPLRILTTPVKRRGSSKSSASVATAMICGMAQKV